MPKKAAVVKAPAKKESDNRMMMLVAYVLTWLTGLIVYLTTGKEDPEARFHGMQAILLGAAMMVIGIVGGVTLIGLVIAVPLNIILWVYGIYVGYKAYSEGERILIPVIGEYAVKYSEKE